MPSKKLTAPKNFFLLLGIIFVALNLRPAIASVGPLVSTIRIDTGLSNTLLGLLTTLPLLAFGVVSTLTPLFTKRLGIEGTIFGALCLLTIGILLRVIPLGIALFGGTLLIGIAIAFGNVLLPSLVKRDFPTKTGVMTSIYSSMLGIGAALGAGISVPLAKGVGLGWRWSLGAWAVLSIIALLIWIPQLRKQTIPKQTRSFRKSLKALLNSKVAWHVAIFMGLQSLAFYVILAWLPEILQDRGIAVAEAGWVLSLSQATGVLGTFLIPTWAERISNQRLIVWLLVILEAVSLVGLMVPDAFLVGLWASLIGFSLGGSFGLALLFIVHRTTNAETATELSGMAQSVGYLLAAIGPTLFGGIHDITGAWFLPLIMLLVVAIAKLIFGLQAASSKA